MMSARPRPVRTRRMSSSMAAFGQRRPGAKIVWHRVLLVATASSLSLATAAAGQRISRDELLFLTQEWKGERFEDGRPHVSDDILKRMKLVTIAGPPGVGKTRFAIELASTVAAEFDDGAAFVELAPVRDPGLVLDTVAVSIGALGQPDRPPLPRLKSHLRGRNILLLLDNFES